MDFVKILGNKSSPKKDETIEKKQKSIRQAFALDAYKPAVTSVDNIYFDQVSF